MAAMPFLCNGALLFQGNLPRVLPVICQLSYPYMDSFLFLCGEWSCLVLKISKSNVFKPNIFFPVFFDDDDLFKTQIIEHMKHSLLIRVVCCEMFISQPPFRGLQSNDRVYYKNSSSVNTDSFCHKNNFLQCNLNVVIEPLSQLKGIFPFIIKI